jgi:potassium-dependent mechanosensitive channel
MRKILLFILLAWSGITYAQTPKKQASKAADSTLFTSDDAPTRSDYLNRFEKIFQLLNKVPVVTESFRQLDEIQDQLKEGDDAITIVRDQLGNDRSLNIRNLQMDNTLLDELDRDMNGRSKQLDAYNDKLDKIKAELADLRKDTLLHQVFRDAALRNQFIPQLQQLQSKFTLADSLIKSNTTIINDLRAHVSSNSIAIEELLNQTDAALVTVGQKAFGKERRYLWEPSTSMNPRRPYNGIRNSVNSEQQLARYYFENTRSKRLLLLFTGLNFFFWVMYNFRSLRRLNKLSAIEPFNFKYIHALPITTALLVILSLAPLFDLHAPAIYIESTQFFLMILMIFIFRQKLSKQLFYGWCVFILLFLFQPIIRMLGMPMSLSRWSNLFQNIFAVLFGLYFMTRSSEIRHKYRFMFWALGIYTLLNALAVFFNLFGRVSLSQIMSTTAVYELAQTASLGVFVRAATEAFLLQIQASRIRKKYPEHFDEKEISKSIYRFITVIAIFLWGIVLSINLNIYDGLTDLIHAIFTTPLNVGSINFTFGGIVLFLGIIWIANFLQRYIAYFFGDVGDDAAFDDKGQRSRLLITRLVLLVIGFLLAVGASGLPMDKITVVLGALGVGIGLGLQGIVNNFVSGIILIFDRPLRIGDTVEIGDKKGRVKEIGIRSSTLLTPEGAEVIMPNGDVLAQHIVNWTLTNNHARIVLSFTINRSAGEDVKPAIKDIIKANENVVERREIEVMNSSITAKTTTLRVVFWCKDITKATTVSESVQADVFEYLEKKGVIAE